MDVYRKNYNSSKTLKFDILHLLPKFFSRHLLLVKSAREPWNHVRRSTLFRRKSFTTCRAPIQSIRAQKTADKAATFLTEVEVIVLRKETDFTFEDLSDGAHVLLQRFNHHTDSSDIIESAYSVQLPQKHLKFANTVIER